MHTQKAFLALLKAGLWNTSPDFSAFTSNVDWKTILNISEEQTVTGIITDGIASLPKEYHGARPVMMQFYARTMTLEDENLRMNAFVPKLMMQLEQKGVRSMLLKGQGVSMCYPRPLHRVVGDIDLLIPDAEEYRNARELMLIIAEEVQEEDKGRKHSAFQYKGFVIEIHGDFRFNINRQCQIKTPVWKRKRLSEVRHIKEDLLKDAVLPPVQFDVLFIFAHLLNHYNLGGVGLRQVSDWMIFLHRNLETIDLAVLQEDLDLLGLRPYWEVFGAMAVDFLGYPKERMPLYDAKNSRKGKIALENIFKTGNFGSIQKQKQLKEGSHLVLKKLVTFAGQVPVFIRNFRVFPKDTLWCFRQFVASSLRGFQTIELTEN